MNSRVALNGVSFERRISEDRTSTIDPANRGGRKPPAPAPFRFTAHDAEEDTAHRHAELFYLQKQIQSQTPMVIMLADGGRVEGCIEWYDRNALKVRGREKTLIYKSAIKYMYKLAEAGQ
ncbi:MAG TPA: RNA chaperone Hfq [Terracidiphilus sp.]|nr:RNA chaperone Hfq [Terracidiphilus sp.]